ncbi:Myb-like protein I [Galdieria sulphuraria]|nr:Myb-like protein I [Galdieria sulphuraria]
MRSTRSRENGRQRQKANMEHIDKDKEDNAECNKLNFNEQTPLPWSTVSAGGDKQQATSNKMTSSEGSLASVQLLEQQKKRIEQLEKDLDDARVEIEKLRLYNRQLALSLTSLHRHGLDSSKFENGSSSFVQQSAITYQHGNSDVCGPLDSTNAYDTSSNNDRVTRNYQEQHEAEEHMRFLEGLARFGHKDMKAIARFVGTRNATQVRTHAQKYYLKLAREAAKRQELQHSQLQPGFGNGSSDERRSCISAPGTPSCRTSIGKRNMNGDDYSFSLESYKSARLENEMLSSDALKSGDFSERDQDITKRMNWFSNATVFRTMSLDQDSSGGELSTTSEGISEPRNVSNDLIHASHYRVGTSELLLEREGRSSYVDLYQRKQEKETNSDSFLKMPLMEGKTGMDSQFDSFSLQHRSNSLTEFVELHDEHFADFENFSKFHSIPEKSIGNLLSSDDIYCHKFFLETAVSKSLVTFSWSTKLPITFDILLNML